MIPPAALVAMAEIVDAHFKAIVALHERRQNRRYLATDPLCDCGPCTEWRDSIREDWSRVQSWPRGEG